MLPASGTVLSVNRTWQPGSEKAEGALSWRECADSMCGDVSPKKDSPRIKTAVLMGCAAFFYSDSWCVIERKRIMTAIQLAIRRTPGNANHHLWNNNGTWWCHYTLHSADYQKVRVRRSLGTADVARAR